MSTIEKPLLVITLMVKDEEQSILDTLNSFLSSKGKNYFFILDTGSKDNTVKIIQEFLKQKDIVGFIKEELFIDFATSRNRTLELAQHYFPNAAFFLMPDAEWHLNCINSLLNFCEKEKNLSTPLYLINAKMNSMEFSTARLLRVANKIKFQGVVHESPEISTSTKCPDSIFFTIKTSNYGKEKSKKRWQRDLLLLTDAFYKNKNDTRTIFYLAQTYECLGLLENAYNFYTIRSQINGWDEENFITFFRLGCLCEELKNNNPHITWATAMDYYLKAFSIRPQRIEPLIKIAMYYWPNNIQTCYLFVKHAYDIPYPKNDILFIEKKMYTYDRYEIMSRCAWYAKEYELGREATKIALSIHPEMQHLQKNLILYEDKIKSIN